ncbi:MAG: hypothetical protein ACRDUS_11720 [Mycobacterium sp.]
MVYWLFAVMGLTVAVAIMVNIERLQAYQWWRYVLYIATLAMIAAALFGVFTSPTSRIGLVCGVIVLALRALVDRAKAIRQKSAADHNLDNPAE